MVKQKGQTISHEESARQRSEARRRNEEKLESDKLRSEEIEASRERNRQNVRNASMKRKQKSFWQQYQQYIMIGAASAVLLLVLNWPQGGEPSEAEQAEIPVIDDSLIATHNESESTYHLGANQLFDGVSVQGAKKLFVNNLTKASNVPKCPASKDTSALPDNYNWSHKYPQCFKLPFNQGLCSSSWAVATASAFTDRYCAKTNDKSYRASVQQLLTCEKKQSSGCAGGFLLGAAEHGRTKGFVASDCMAYKPYDVALDCNWSEINKCHSKQKVEDYCVVEGTEAIKREIFTNGPVVSLFPIYRDFLLYKDGVYAPAADVRRIEGHQAVKVMGWNTEGKNSYWLIENSFGEEWGESGLAKIKMGVHDSGLDKSAVSVFLATETEEQ